MAKKPEVNNDNKDSGKEKEEAINQKVKKEPNQNISDEDSTKVPDDTKNEKKEEEKKEEEKKEEEEEEDTSGMRAMRKETDKASGALCVNLFLSHLSVVKQSPGSQ